MKKIVAFALLNLSFLGVSLAAPSSGVLSDEQLKALQENKTTVNNSEEVGGYYKIIFPNTNPYTTKDNVVKFEGIVSDNVDYIIVDDYRLSKYKPGNTKWNYFANIKYGNLKEGLNTYKIKYYDKNGKLLKEDEIVIYKKADNSEKVNKYKKKLDEKIFEIKNMKNICGAFSIQNYDSLLKRKATFSFYMKKYNTENGKDILEGIPLMDKYKYFYDGNSNSCIAKKFFTNEIGFDSFEECKNSCISGGNSSNIDSNNVVVNNYNNGPTNIYNPNYIVKKTNLYSSSQLALIADKIIKRKNNNLEKLEDLQNRTKLLISTLENGNLNVKYSTKINFLNLLKILDRKINQKIFEIKNPIIENKINRNTPSSINIPSTPKPAPTSTQVKTNTTEEGELDIMSIFKNIGLDE